MNDDPLLRDLTDDQRDAVTHGEGPLLILAGAGSGKTRVITRRVAYLLRSGVRAGNILAITFTNKAASEMRKRVDAIVPGNRVTICTFHSLGVRLLRQYADRLNIDKNFTIYDADVYNKMVKDALDKLGIEDPKITPDRVSGAIRKAKTQLLTPKAYAAQAHDFFSQATAKVYFEYERILRLANGMDFDDLLYLPALALKLDEELRAEIDARFKYVLIDEYQDTNSAQYEIARRLSLHHPNLCVVGDPDQSIYKWRGSDIRNILDFERDFPNARVVTLARNYRSTPNILHAAGTLIEHNIQRKKKALVTDNHEGSPVQVMTYDNGLEEAEGTVLRIKESVKSGKSKYGDHAIFLRVNALSRTLESGFVKHGIPFQIVKGLAFFERKENRDVIAYLRLLVNPSDTVSFLRVVNEPARGIGKVNLERLRQYADTEEITLLTATLQVHKIPEIKGKALVGLRDFHRLITELRTQLEMPPHELIRLVLDKSGYRKMLAESSDEEDADRLANIEELVTAAKQFYDEDPSRTLADFLEQITLASDTDSFEESADRVSVMTLHSAKGLEFPIVHMLAVEQGLLPHERSLSKTEDVEEERRLCYVGMTRAMRELTLSHARMRDFRGQTMYAIPSLFLEELPKEVKRIDAAASRIFARGSIANRQRAMTLAPECLDPKLIDRDLLAHAEEARESYDAELVLADWLDDQDKEVEEKIVRKYAILRKDLLKQYPIWYIGTDGLIAVTLSPQQQLVSETYWSFETWDERLKYISGITNIPLSEEWRTKIGSTAAAAGYSVRATVLPPIKPRIDDSSSASGDYRSGQTVQHEQYGIGRITDVSGFGALRRIRIRFASAGEKTFVAEKVKLRMVSKT